MKKKPQSTLEEFLSDPKRAADYKKGYAKFVKNEERLEAKGVKGLDLKANAELK